MDRDMTFCDTRICPDRLRCERYMGIPKDGIIAVSDFYGLITKKKELCTYFIPTKEWTDALEMDKQWPY